MKKILLITVVFASIAIIALIFFRQILPSSQSYALTITDCAVTGDSNITVTEGDEVTLQVTSNSDAEFHIHGYDLMRDLSANKEERITFTASTPGTYEYELEGRCDSLGSIRVTTADGVIPTTAEEKEEEHTH